MECALSQHKEDELTYIDMLSISVDAEVRKLPPAERKLLMGCIRHPKDIFKPSTVSITARIVQHNTVSAYIGRLVARGWLEKVARGQYRLSTANLDWLKCLHFKYGCFNSFSRNGFLDGQERPLTYLINNREYLLQTQRQERFDRERQRMLEKYEGT